MNTYEMVEGTTVDSENQPCRVYGVGAEGITFFDVSGDQEKIADLVCLLNESDLDPIHLEDVLSDFVQENAMF